MLQGQGVDDSIEGLVKRMVANGPTRVVVDQHAQAVSPPRALAMGIRVDIIFVRGDGWTLGSPEVLEWTAYNTWAGDWVHMLVVTPDGPDPFTIMTPSEWLERFNNV